jgi:predicted amidohydrolase
LYQIFLKFDSFNRTYVQTAYKAGVLEYNPRTSDSPINTIVKNLEEFRFYADKARTQAVDILVFPEYGLTTLVDPEDYALEIHPDQKIIRELATIATERQMYLVVNLLEIARDDRNNTKYYNTNLVFARNGTIIAKYVFRLCVSGALDHLLQIPQDKSF